MKNVLVIFLLYLCSVELIAQDYYFYKGEKIPLEMNNDRVCLSIPKKCTGIRDEVVKNFKVDEVLDSDFDIFVIQQSDFEKLSKSSSWGEKAKCVLLSPCYKTIDNKDVCLSPYLNVRLKRDEDVHRLSSLAKEYGLKIVRQDSFLKLWYVLSITSDTGKNALECANALWESGEFAASIPDLCSDDRLCSNDPLFNDQWGLYNSNHTDIDISICSAWDYATGRNVSIGILDQGVDMEHIDLASNISSLSYDTETNSSPSICYGYHATHCAGIAAAISNNSIHIAGVAPEATIVSISNSLTASTNSRLKRADGIIWAYQNGVDIISNSWHSSTYHSAIDEAIQAAFTYGRQGKGCIIVFAAGNDSSSVVSYPGNCNDTILVVGAIGDDGIRASFSQYGSKLDVVAPGVNILSTLPNNQIGYKSGTSMACPFVAGVAALILERNPYLSVSQVNSIINTNAKKINGVNFNTPNPDGLWNTEYGYGLVDAYNSVLNTPTVIYIQNESITGVRTIAADSIFVGKDVTDTKEFGDVILGPGEITLKANSVIVKNSTSVPLGTIFKIENK